MGAEATFTLGSYAPGESLVHRLDARTKILVATCFAIAGMLVHPAGLIPLSVVLAIGFALARVPLRLVRASLRPMLIFALFAFVLNALFGRGGTTLLGLGPLAITTQGIAEGLLALARLIIAGSCISLLTLTTTISDCIEGGTLLGEPLARLGVPMRDLSMTIGIALRFMPLLASEALTIRQAQRSRGALGASGGGVGGRIRQLLSLAVPLFASALRRSETLALAMEGRAYGYARTTTRLDPLRFGHEDGIASAIAFAALCLAIGIGIAP